MRKNKLIIIIVSTILILIGLIFTILCLTTDMFKSNKKIFYKYISQINLSGFVNENFSKEYSDRIKNNKYSQNTNIKIEYNGENIEKINKEINIQSKRDLENKLASSKIIVGNDEKKDIEVEYLRNEDTYGIMIKKIAKQYVAIENNNLKELLEKIGISDINNIQIPDKIEIDKLTQGNDIVNNILTEEEKNEFINKYKSLIVENIPKECYSKTEEEIEFEDGTISANGYKIELTIEQLGQILKLLLEELINDEKLANKICEIGNKVNESFSQEEYKQGIQDLIDSLDEEGMSEEEKNIKILSITVYEKDKKIKKVSLRFGIEELGTNISVEFSDKPRIKINSKKRRDEEKKIEIVKSMNTDNQEILNISASLKQNEIEFNINLDIERNGKSSSENIDNKIKLSFDSKEFGNGNLEIIDSVKFDSNIEIEKFTKDNSLLINNLSEKQIKNLFTNLMKKMDEKIEDKSTYIYAVVGLPFAITDGTLSESGIIGIAGLGMVGVGITVTNSINNSLFEKADETLHNTRNAMLNEAVSLAKADILQGYMYGEITTDEITEELIKGRIEEYIGETYNVEVVKENDLEFNVIAEISGSRVSQKIVFDNL